MGPGDIHDTGNGLDKDLNARVLGGQREKSIQCGKDELKCDDNSGCYT